MSIGSHSMQILPDAARGKALEAIEVYQDDQGVYLDLKLEQGLAVELSFAATYRHKLTLVQWEHGNSRVLESREA